MLSRQRLVADKQCCTVPTWSQRFEEQQVGTNYHQFVNSL
jgi:hypothetical protein